MDAQSDLGKILHRKVDRHFPLIIDQLTDNELDYEIYKRMTDLNENFFYVRLKYHRLFADNRFLSFPLLNNRFVKLIFFPFYALFFFLGHLGRFVENSILINQMLPHRHTRYRRRIQELEDVVASLQSRLENRHGKD
jgi:hypothetical protein